jgi:DNA-directed RNA polymerase subunit K/omega
MARITVEDCLKKIDNRFGLIHLVVVALREIAAGQVFRLEDGDDDYSSEDKEDLISEELPEQSDETSSNDEKINEKEKEQK